MAYVPVPKDLSKIKTKLAFNLTKRQLVCFSGAAAVGLPAYLFSRGSIGNSAAKSDFTINKNGTPNRGNIYKKLRTSKLQFVLSLFVN